MQRGPNRSSLLWAQCMEGALNSESHRAHTCASTPRLFALAAGKQLHEFYRRGYPWAALTKEITHFIRSNAPLYPAEPASNSSPATLLPLITATAYHLHEHGMPELEHRLARIGGSPAGHGPPISDAPPGYHPGALLPAALAPCAP